MTDKPILFSAPMIRALLDGRKTQTRRTLKLKPLPQAVDASGRWYRMPSGGESLNCHALPYAIGDRLFPAMSIPSLNRNYCADLYGRIWSRARDGETWELLKGSSTSNGYLSVTPAHEGRYRTRLVHRLVAEAFYGHEPGRLKQVRHLNGNQTDNTPENLDWGTQEDNWSDRYAHGKGSGEHHHAAKLSRAQVDQIRASTTSQRSLAAQFGVAQSTIWAVRMERVWQENPDANPPNCPRWASRLTLTVTDVRVERLQDISEADAIAESIKTDVWASVIPSLADPSCADAYAPEMSIYWHEDDDSDDCVQFTAKAAFAKLWDRINGPGAWDDNPWVVALTFTVYHGNIDQVTA